jgi:L-aspartate oxidase
METGILFLFTTALMSVPRLLLTEAIRGEGGWIVDDHGRRFLVDALPEAELAPRDQVSRAILRHLAKPGVSGVFLDLTHLDAAHLAARFPGVVASCRAHGLDVARDRIPIHPAHYDRQRAPTAKARADWPSSPRAEVAATGLHGANRLASLAARGPVFGRSSGWRPPAARPRPSGPIRMRLRLRRHSAASWTWTTSEPRSARCWREAGWATAPT